MDCNELVPKECNRASLAAQANPAAMSAGRGGYLAVIGRDLDEATVSSKLRAMLIADDEDLSPQRFGAALVNYKVLQARWESHCNEQSTSAAWLRNKAAGMMAENVRDFIKLILGERDPLNSNTRAVQVCSVCLPADAYSGHKHQPEYGGSWSSNDHAE